MAGRLAQDDKVKLAITADKALEAFTDKYFATGTSPTDSEPDPKRVADANRKAEAFPTDPRAELLKKLAEPSVKP